MTTGTETAPVGAGVTQIRYLRSGVFDIDEWRVFAKEVLGLQKSGGRGKAHCSNHSSAYYCIKDAGHWPQ